MIRFDTSSRDVMARAYEIHRRYDSNLVDSPHLLLALLEQNGSATTQILTRLKVDSARLRAGIDDILQKRPQGKLGKNGDVFIMPRAKQVIDLAYEVSTRDQAPTIDVSHLWQAITAERDTPLAELLTEYSITPARIDEALHGE